MNIYTSRLWPIIGPVFLLWQVNYNRLDKLQETENLAIMGAMHTQVACKVTGTAMTIMEGIVVLIVGM